MTDAPVTKDKMTDEQWADWCIGNEFVLIGFPKAMERAWAHADGYGYTTLRLVWGRSDGKADAVLLKSGREDGINVASVDAEGAAVLVAFFTQHEHRVVRDGH